MARITVPYPETRPDLPVRTSLTPLDPHPESNLVSGTDDPAADDDNTDTDDDLVFNPDVHETPTDTLLDHTDVDSYPTFPFPVQSLVPNWKRRRHRRLRRGGRRFIFTEGFKLQRTKVEKVKSGTRTGRVTVPDCVSEIRTKGGNDLLVTRETRQGVGVSS